MKGQFKPRAWKCATTDYSVTHTLLFFCPCISRIRIWWCGSLKACKWIRTAACLWYFTDLHEKIKNDHVFMVRIVFPHSHPSVTALDVSVSSNIVQHYSLLRTTCVREKLPLDKPCTGTQTYRIYMIPISQAEWIWLLLCPHHTHFRRTCAHIHSSVYMSWKRAAVKTRFQPMTRERSDTMDPANKTMFLTHDTGSSTDIKIEAMSFFPEH